MCSLFNSQQHCSARNSECDSAEPWFRPCSAPRGRDSLPGVSHTAVLACPESPRLKSTHRRCHNFITEVRLTCLCGSPVDREPILTRVLGSEAPKGSPILWRTWPALTVSEYVHIQLLWEVKSYKHHRDSPLLIPLTNLAIFSPDFYVLSLTRNMFLSHGK